MTVAIAILAAGAGSRMNADVAKPLVEFRGRTLVGHAVDAALGARIGPVFVVVGNAMDAVVSAVADRPAVAVPNPQWRDGIASSLAAAVRAVEGNEAIGALGIGLADQPFIGSEAYRRLADAYDAGATLAVATYDGVRGNPVLIARTLWPEALALRGDEGARQLMRAHPVIEVACDDTGAPDDIDTPHDLMTLSGRNPAAPDGRPTKD